MAARCREEEVFPDAAGIDVGASSHWVAVPNRSSDESVREFGAMTDDLNAMANWLLSCGVDTVALEFTGVYWIPVFEVLEQRGPSPVPARQQVSVPPGCESCCDDSHRSLAAGGRPNGYACGHRAFARPRRAGVWWCAGPSWLPVCQREPNTSASTRENSSSSNAIEKLEIEGKQPK